jgi:hypothetical protein
MSFQNKRRGFTDNNNPGSMLLEHCTAYDNEEFGFNFQVSSPTITSSISFGNGDGTENKFKDGVKDSGNSWNNGGWSKDKFQSTSSTTLTGARKANGNLPATSFLLPADGKSLGADFQNW